jgi:hypothetical protein
MDLIRRSLCEDANDYESLLANMSIVMNTLDCDDKGRVILTQPGVLILTDMFTGTEFWKGCFKERNVFYYTKSCGYESIPYQSASGADECAAEAQEILYRPADALYVNGSGELANKNIVSFTVTQGSADASTFEITALTVNQNTLFALADYANSYFVLCEHYDSGAGKNESTAFYFTIDGVGTAPTGFTNTVIIPLVTITHTSSSSIAALIDTVIPGGFISSYVPASSLVTITHGGFNGPLPTLDTFAKLAEAYACYLGALGPKSKLEDVQKVILSFCSVLRDRVRIDRTLNKSMLTIGRCDL